jgi:hypothetical protein
MIEGENHEMGWTCLEILRMAKVMGGRICESCKQEQASRLLGPKLSHRTVAPYTGGTPMLPGHPSPITTIADAPVMGSSPLPALPLASNLGSR